MLILGDLDTISSKSCNNREQHLHGLLHVLFMAHIIIRALTFSAYLVDTDFRIPYFVTYKKRFLKRQNDFKNPTASNRLDVVAKFGKYVCLENLCFYLLVNNRLRYVYIECRCNKLFIITANNKVIPIDIGLKIFSRNLFHESKRLVRLIDHHIQ